MEKGILNARYRLVRRIGKGGMGDVYLALDLEHQQDVAIKTLTRKLLPARSAGPDAVERFQREANILKKLRHNNIIEFIDYFIEKEDHYIVMEYVSGGSLHERLLGDSRSDNRAVCEFGLSLVSALTAAHDLGIVHRDIKPSNILFAADDTVRLTDFGVARLKTSSTIDSVRESTAWGTMPGTIVYMSPESLSYGARADEHSDIWGLGIVFYEMLVGGPPFQGGDNEKTAEQIRNAPLPPISAHVADVWPALEVIVNRMLTKNPADRYPSMRFVGAALDNALRMEGVIQVSPLKAALQRAVQRAERGQWGSGDSSDPTSTPSPSLRVADRQEGGETSLYNNQYGASRALLIAPGAYRDKSIAPMPHALRGANLLGQLLRAHFDFDVEILSGDKVTLEAVQQTIHALQKSAPNDRLVIYWAGAARTRSDRYGYEMSFLATYDTVWQDWATFIEIEDLVDVRFLAAKHVFFILDALTLGPINITTGLSEAIHLEKALTHAGLHALSAGLRHYHVKGPTTLFTDVLLRGLRGQAAADGIVSADSLGQFVVQQVPLYSKGEQQPIYARLPGGEEGNLLFQLPPAAYLPGEVLLGVHSDYPSVRHGMVQILRDFALQPQEEVQQAALEQLDHLGQEDPTQSVKDAARQVLRELLGDATEDNLENTPTDPGHIPRQPPTKDGEL